MTQMQPGVYAEQEMSRIRKQLAAQTGIHPELRERATLALTYRLTLWQHDELPGPGLRARCGPDPWTGLTAPPTGASQTNRRRCDRFCGGHGYRARLLPSAACERPGDERYRSREFPFSGAALLPTSDVGTAHIRVQLFNFAGPLESCLGSRCVGPDVGGCCAAKIPAAARGLN